MKEKYSMPQVSSLTGVSHDYSNEITTLRISFLEGYKEKIIKRIKDQPVKKYQERYPENLNSDVITEKNREAINRLNELADKLNQIGLEKDFDDKQFVSVYNEMITLIYGPYPKAQISLGDFGRWKK